MIRALPLLALSSLALVACGTLREDIPKGPVAQFLFPDRDPLTPDMALERYYDTISDDLLPVAPIGRALPGEGAVLTRILLASCNNEEQPSPALARIAREPADLLLMLGDNVYGDRDGTAYINNDADLTELRQSFTDLAERAEFRAVRGAHPMMVTWDDHDYGANDAGGDYPFKRFSERIHERFWGLDQEGDVGQWDGTYYARSFGPEGQRVQIIMLDTRFFRSALTLSDEPGTPGKERYIPSKSPTQDMLGTTQWNWLQNQLAKPADIRLIVSSIQVLPTVHGYEAWSTLPDERRRLFEMIRASGKSGIIFLSGDRHAGFIYQDDAALNHPTYELTSSSLNLPLAGKTAERDTRQTAAGIAQENFGEIAIDWAVRELTLTLRDKAGEPLQTTTARFGDLGIGAP